MPTPRIKLGDVEVGEPGREPQLRAGAVEVEVGLGPLLRGQVQATELRLLAPQIGLGIDRAGAIDWPAPSPAFGADTLTISRLEVEDGRVTITDAGSGSRVVLQKPSFNGDIRSFAGPFGATAPLSPATSFTAIGYRAIASTRTAGSSSGSASTPRIVR